MVPLSTRFSVSSLNAHDNKALSDRASEKRERERERERGFTWLSWGRSLGAQQIEPTGRVAILLVERV